MTEKMTVEAMKIEETDRDITDQDVEEAIYRSVVNALAGEPEEATDPKMKARMQRMLDAFWGNLKFTADGRIVSNKQKEHCNGPQ